jgi:hypothetical protein
MSTSLHAPPYIPIEYAAKELETVLSEVSRTTPLADKLLYN